MSRVESPLASQTSISILHADDDGAFRELVDTVITHHHESMEIESVRHAREGIQAFDRNQVDCIISDWDMMDMGGLGFLKQIRKNHPNFPFIIYSNERESRIADKVISAGATDFIRKSAGEDHYEELTQRVASAVYRQSDAVPARNVEQLFESISEKSQDVCWLFSSESEEFTFVSGPYKPLFGQDVESILNDPYALLDTIHPSEQQRVEQTMESAREGISFNTRYQVNESNDFASHVWVRGEPIFNESGEITHIGGFCRPISRY